MFNEYCETCGLDIQDFFEGSEDLDNFCESCYNKIIAISKKAQAAGEQARQKQKEQD